MEQNNTTNRAVEYSSDSPILGPDTIDTFIERLGRAAAERVLSNHTIGMMEGMGSQKTSNDVLREWVKVGLQLTQKDYDDINSFPRVIPYVAETVSGQEEISTSQIISEVENTNAA